MLISCSNEQEEIINNIENYNIIVEAMAGSGKTTTALHIAKKYENLKILLLTYNAKLKEETREKVINLNLDNIEVCSYHSFCVKYYNHKSFTDKQIINIILKNSNPLQLFQYDLIILDEVQDMTDIYYKLVNKIIIDNKIKPKLCLFGDPRQCIFQFNGADDRFLKYANELFNINNFGWKRLHLKTSFRITKQMANCLNNVCFKENRINSTKEGTLPEYYILDPFSFDIVKIVQNFLKDYRLDQIFILAPSVKKGPIAILSNRLNKIGIRTYVSNTPNEIKDKDLTKNKLVLTTFHQVKGLEREVVIIYNFDSSYYQFYDYSEFHSKKIPNVYYVAMTRAKEKLVIFNDFSYNPMTFLNITNLSTFFNKKQLHYTDDIKKIKPKQKQIIFPVLSLLEYIPSNIINECMNFIGIEEIPIDNKFEKIIVDYKTKQDDIFEFVSDITGTAIPTFYEYFLYKKTSINETLRQHKPNKYKEFFNFDISNINDSLKLTTEYMALQSGFKYKKSQIKKYNWLNEDLINDCILRLQNLNFKNPQFEVSIKKSINNYTLIGSIDLIDINNIYEFKCTNNVSDEHFIQLAIYGYLNDNFDNLYLYNIFLNKLYKIKINENFKENVILTLINIKNDKDQNKLNDIDFKNNYLDYKKND